MSFFTSECLTRVTNQEFGIRDDKPNQPAYVDSAIQNKAYWLASVNNPQALNLEFYAIDNCIIYENIQNEKESTCDSAIQYKNEQLYFIELKDRKSSGWLGKAAKQLKNTLSLYKQNQANPANKIECYVCNPQKPSAPTSNLSYLKSFKQETGYKLNVSVQINIVSNENML